VSAPATPGIALDAVDTPALLIDLDAFERNIARLTESIAGRGVRLRAHAKTHKCAEIARRQLAAGAIGMCCQKVSEAEAMVAGGVADVLVSNEVVGERKLARLAALARHARLGVCVDDADNVRALSAAARRADVALDVYVEIDVGARRCGVAPGEPALALARDEAERLARTDHLTGLNNRRAFYELGEAALRHAVRYEHPTALIAIDIVTRISKLVRRRMTSPDVFTICRQRVWFEN